MSGLRSWVWGPYSPSAALAVALTFLVDQAHKWSMLKIFGYREGVPHALTPFLNIVYVRNTGISYSLFDQKGMAGQYGLAAFAVLASLAIWVWLIRPATTRLLAVSLGLIVGGALGNALDRVLLGGVADFFQLHAYGFYWYVFNIADVAIVAGVIGLLYDSLRSSRKDAVKSA